MKEHVAAAQNSLRALGPIAMPAVGTAALAYLALMAQTGLALSLIFALPAVALALSIRQGSKKAQPAREEAAAAIERAEELTGLLRERDQLSRELCDASRRDPLTGLPNRTVLDERLERGFSTDSHFAAAFIDLDHFKQINDRLGHDAGDELIRSTAERIQAALAPSELLTRYGGDEFVAILEATTVSAVETRCAELLHRVRAPIPWQGATIEVDATIGLALRRDAAEPRELLQQADLALYRAKRDQRGTVAAYDAATDLQPLQLRDLEGDLRQAVLNDEIRAVYQPLVDMDSGELIGFEALARWDHPTLGLLSPDAFIPLAEQTGLIVELGQTILRQASTQLADWSQRASAPSTLRMSVNVSPIQLTDGRFLDTVRDLLAGASYEPAQLTLEVTETTVLADLETATRALTALKALGVRIALDDFGTGFSSMRYLHQLPIDVIKLDRSFVTEIASDERLRSVVSALHQVAVALGVDVIAEGVEQMDDVEALRAIGCRIGQGFQFARPLASAAAGALLAARPDWISSEVPMPLPIPGVQPSVLAATASSRSAARAA